MTRTLNARDFIDEISLYDVSGKRYIIYLTDKEADSIGADYTPRLSAQMFYTILDNGEERLEVCMDPNYNMFSNRINIKRAYFSDLEAKRAGRILTKKMLAINPSFKLNKNILR